MVSSDQGSHHLNFQVILPAPVAEEDSHCHWPRALLHTFLALSALGLNLGLPGRAGVRRGGRNLETGSGCGNNASLAHACQPLLGWSWAGSSLGKPEPGDRELLQGTRSAQNPFLQEAFPDWPPKSGRGSGLRSVPLCYLICCSMVFAMCFSSFFSNDGLSKASPFSPCPFFSWYFCTCQQTPTSSRGWPSPVSPTLP